MADARYDPSIYTPWILYDICKQFHPPGCDCTPAPGGLNPHTGSYGPAPADETVVQPPPSGSTVPPAITLPYAIMVERGPANAAEALVAAGLKPDLAASMAPALVATGVNWMITSGRRSEGEQEMLMRTGATSTPPSASNHVPCPGDIWSHAVDLDPMVDEAHEAAQLSRLAVLLRSAAAPGGPWRWGGTFGRPSPHHFDVVKPCR